MELKELGASQIVQKEKSEKILKPIYRQVIYPGDDVSDKVVKPKNAQVWHRDWGTTWESKAEYDRKKQEEALFLAKKDLEEIEIKKEALQQELKESFQCSCGFKSKSEHGLKIHRGSCERK